MSDKKKDAKHDINRNGIDDAIEPPIPDVAAGEVAAAMLELSSPHRCST